MSKENVKKLFEIFCNDAELQNKCFELMREHHKTMEKALAGKLVEFGKSSGFAFSTDDLIAARAELMDKNNGGGELSDNDLASVAGGGAKERKDLAIAMSVTTAGFGCGFASVVIELSQISKPGGCGREMTTVNCN